MDLKSFVEETLTQIVLGVRSAQTRVRQEGAKIVPGLITLPNQDLARYSTTQSLRDVEFDVAVATEESKETGGKGGIKVISVEAQKTTANTTLSRVKFAIPLYLPEQE